jgi:hypothetical protein
MEKVRKWESEKVRKDKNPYSELGKLRTPNSNNKELQ